MYTTRSHSEGVRDIGYHFLAHESAALCVMGSLPHLEKLFLCSCVLLQPIHREVHIAITILR